MVHSGAILAKMTLLPQTRGFLSQNGGFGAKNDGAPLPSSWGTMPPMGAAMALLADPLDQPMDFPGLCVASLRSTSWNEIFLLKS